MTFEEVLINVLQSNSTGVSSSVYRVNCELKEINRTLQFIGIQLKELNKHITEINPNKKM